MAIVFSWDSCKPGAGHNELKLTLRSFNICHLLESPSLSTKNHLTHAGVSQVGHAEDSCVVPADGFINSTPLRKAETMSQQGSRAVAVHPSRLKC